MLRNASSPERESFLAERSTAAFADKKYLAKEKPPSGELTPQAAEGVFMEVSISMPGDLHNHSTCSDGSVPIHRLPLMAARAGLDTMAISDHDTLLSVNYCYEHPV